MLRYSIVSACNKPAILEDNLLKSPNIFSHDIHIKYEYTNICKAYNEAIKECTEEIIIFVHQDVFLPENFFEDLLISIAKLIYTEWGVLGVAGITHSGRLSSDVIDRGSILKTDDLKPALVQTIDELILIVKKRSFDKLVFDENIINNHLFGTDLCLQAEQHWMKNFIIEAPCFHNSLLVSLPNNYFISQEYIREKWSCSFPIHTTCSIIR